MNNSSTISQLTSFAKKSNLPTARETKNCVIYTRVSSKEQEDNSSLESQKRYCKEYCDKKGIHIGEYFGGTYESAQKDERKEFKKMLDYVRRNKNIDSIVVYSYDRFSRSGANAIYLTNELANTGVKLLAVSQETDTSTPSGKFQKNIFLLFSQFDNDLRRDKTMKGMIENMKQGYWVAMTPFGYTNLHRKEKAKNHKYIINKDGELLKMAFKMKAEGILSNREIVSKIQKLGSTLTYKNFNAIISNPFYCGFISHKMIPGELIKGHHPALITEQLFLKANAIKEQSLLLGIKKKAVVEELPLKVFARDATTLAPFTGFKQKGIFYYKGRHVSGATVNANHLNKLFENELQQFEFDKKYNSELKEKILNTVCDKLKDEIQNQVLIKKQLTELSNKIEKLEVRFIEESIDKALYDKFLLKFKNDKAELEQKLMTALGFKPLQLYSLNQTVVKIIFLS